MKGIRTVTDTSMTTAVILTRIITVTFFVIAGCSNRAFYSRTFVAEGSTYSRAVRYNGIVTLR